MKGYNSDYGNGGTGGGSGSGGPVNGKDYNEAGSNSVGEVDSVNVTADEHGASKTGTPNSVTRDYNDGRLRYERYYDGDGNAYLDIDYSDHGNPKTHPTVPHEHNIWFDKNGGFHRGRDNGINK